LKSPPALVSQPLRAPAFLSGRSRLAIAEGRAANVGAAARIATRMFVENRRRCAGGSPPWERRIVEM
jgi:hypothetical protein